jgi:hypothetical protein
VVQIDLAARGMTDFPQVGRPMPSVVFTKTLSRIGAWFIVYRLDPTFPAISPVHSDPTSENS